MRPSEKGIKRSLSNDSLNCEVNDCEVTIKEITKKNKGRTQVELEPIYRNKDNENFKTLGLFPNNQNSPLNIDSPSELAQKKDRIQNRLINKQRSVSSFISRPRQSIASVDQIKEIYSECIKLSAANKINSKNAFGLKLIDYMSDLIKNDSGEQINFKLASSALDAGAKIYGHRVDCVHAEAQKVASGLVMALDKDKGGNDYNEEDDLDVDREDGENCDSRPKKKKPSKKIVKTIAPNMDSINVAKIDCNIPTDPLFAQLSASFDVGNVNGLLMTNLTLNNNYQLLLDSNVLPLEKSFKDVSNLKAFSEILQNIISSNAQLIPKLEHFKFLDRNEAIKNPSDLDSNISLQTAREESQCPSFAFNINTFNNEPDTFEATDPVGGDYCSDLENDSIEDVLENNERQLLRAVDPDGFANLIMALSDKPTDYCYFSKEILGAWAGPEYWRVNPSAKLVKKKALKDTEKAKKSKNQFQEIDFKNPPPLVKPDRNAKDNCLKFNTISKWTERLLPKDPGYDPMRLLKSYLKGVNLVKIDERKGDKEINHDEYCEDENDNGNVDDYDDYNNDDEAFPSQAYSGLGEGADLGDLIEQPYTISQTILPYSTQAKTIDVKKLKKEMWNILNIDSHNSPTKSLNNDNDSLIQRTEITFSSVYNKIKEQGTTIANNLSKHIAFVALLHLANEKNLILQGKPDLSDLSVIIEGDVR